MSESSPSSGDARWRFPVTLLWVLGALAFASRLVLAWRHSSADFYAVWLAVTAFLDHRPPYDASSAARALQFLYPPSSLLLFAPFGAMSFEWARRLFLGLQALCLLASGVLCLRLFRVPWTSAWGAVMLLTLSLYVPVTQTLYSGNVNSMVLLGEAAALLAAARRRWVVAGICLGVSLAIKPVLLPLLVLPVLARQWLGAAVAVAIPAGLSVVAGLLAGDRSAFMTRFLPLLLSGQPPDEQMVSLRGTGTVFGMPDEAVLVLRLVVLVMGTAALWWWWRSSEVDEMRLVAASGAILSTTFLVTSTVSWGQYAIYLLPLLTSVSRGGPMAGWLGALAAYGLGAPDLKLWLAVPRGMMFWQLRVTLGLVLTLIALARGGWVAGHRRSGESDA